MDPRAALLTPLEAAKRLGITVRTLHRWEEAGYVHPIRTPTNHRRYDPVEIDALRTSKASA
jgi:DNA-binding transcriptional MerR regulator